MRLPDIARLARAWSEILTVTEEKRTLAAGAPVACAKGCGACCRERVPVSPAEAFALVEILEGMPEPLREHRRERFRAAREKFAEQAPRDEAEYFRLGITCPFLEEESCSIHPDWPLACREHLVLSAPAHCAGFPNLSIRILHLSHGVREALALVCAELLGGAPVSIPLILAPAWVAEHGELGQLAWDGEKVASALAHHVFSR